MPIIDNFQVLKLKFLWHYQYVAQQVAHSFCAGTSEGYRVLFLYQVLRLICNTDIVQHKGGAAPLSVLSFR